MPSVPGRRAGCRVGKSIGGTLGRLRGVGGAGCRRPAPCSRLGGSRGQGLVGPRDAALGTSGAKVDACGSLLPEGGAPSRWGVFDFPAEHWIPLRTTNPIESTFSTVRRRARGTAALAMVFKLVESAQQRWRAGGQRASPRPPAQLHVPGHIARQFVLSNDVPGWGCVLVRPGDSRSIRWCPIGHFGLMVVTVFRWVAHLSGERWATPAVRRCVVRVGMPSLCPGVQAVIRFASSGAVRRGPRWEFLGGPLS